MTVTGTAPASASRGPGLHERLAENPAVVVALRWGLVLVTAVIAFWQTLGAVATEMVAGTIITYLPAAVVLVVIAAVGISWRRATELPIYDRQTDVIVGVVLLVISISVKAMNLRYPGEYLTTHVDLLALWVFLLGGACMVFGLRPIARYRGAWFLLLVIFPVPYRIIVLPLGGDSLAAGVVMVAFGAIATGVATGRTLNRGLAGAAIAGVVGVVALIGVWLIFPHAARVVYQTVPAVGAALVASALLYVDHRRRHESWTPLGRPMYSVSVRKVGRPGLALVVFAVAMFFIPIPSYGQTPNQEIDGLDTRPPLVVPSGWVQKNVTRYDWVERLYGPESTMTVQDLFQAEGSTDFDKFARPRRVEVNAVEATTPLRFEVYPAIFVYDFVGDRFSEPIEVPLPHGVTGYLQTIVDDESYLTFTRLYWSWTDGQRTQRVSLLSVDNHDPDAAFPVPDLTVARNLATFMTVLFRGNSVTVDLEPQFKDRDLLVGCASDLINAQVGAIGEESR
ncbi:hypothetical protein [Gordonia hankookensis]|uniref:Uncharacterized protein n=1 Tax=Gordonia hankookensis TaxID=589403 RepID=A0ABR7W8H9_9ACTN|nr:hypothetical protein [Gordonia hankookensis]MBD1319120.1 hypothetical protein [Gordonia hankookensis]